MSLAATSECRFHVGAQSSPRFVFAWLLPRSLRPKGHSDDICCTGPVSVLSSVKMIFFTFSVGPCVEYLEQSYNAHMPRLSRVGDLGELWTGFQVRSAITDVPEAPHRLISLGDVTEDGINPDRLARMDLGNRVWKYILNPGDILLRPRGANYKAAVVPDLGSPLVATAPLYVLRLTVDGALPEYVVWWVNRTEIQDRLAADARGSYIPTVAKEAFADIEIPLPPLKVQGAIAEVQRLRMHEKDLVSQLDSALSRKIEATLERAATTGKASR